MFGWRRRRDGFEWREYVRTTILVRRQKRRDRVEEVGAAAVDGLARAGRVGAAAGRSGAAAAQRGLGAAARQAGNFSVAAARWAHANARQVIAAAIPMGRTAASAAGRRSLAAGRISWQAAARISSAAAKAGRRGGARAKPLLADIGSKLGPTIHLIATPQTALPLAVAGGAAALGALARVLSHGFDATAIIAGLIATVLLLLAALPYATRGRLCWLSQLSGLRLPLSRVWALRSRPRAIGFVGAALVGALVASFPLGLIQLQPSLGLADFMRSLWPASGGSEEIVAGYAVSLTGDSMRIDGKIVHMADIEAPELTQTCARGDGGTWNCGQAALSALRRLTGRNTISCEVLYTDASGRRISRCRAGEIDLAAEMVRNGHVFASGGLFPTYGSQQAEAQAAEAGLWSGSAARPQDYRNERWEEASREAPDGCPIKGRVLASGKVYLLPWSRSYEAYRVRESRGDRWFCKEDDALSDGWKPYDS